jgi:hypothetical protein
MKKKRYASGGMTQADIDAGLTQADVDAGLRAGRNERISSEDRAEALRMAGTLSDRQAADLMEREVNMPPARPVPVAPRRAITPRPLSAPSASRQDVADAVAQAVAGREPQAPEPRRGASPYIYGGPSPLDPILRNTAGARRSRQESERAGRAMEGSPFKKGGSVKSSASKRGDGCAVRGKTKGRMV